MSEPPLLAFSGPMEVGYPKEAPYDAIHVGAASSDHEMKELVDQLAKGGRMFVPVGSTFGGQEIVMMDKDDAGNVTKKSLMGVRVSMSDCKQKRCPDYYSSMFLLRIWISNIAIKVYA